MNFLDLNLYEPLLQHILLHSLEPHMQDIKNYIGGGLQLYCSKIIRPSKSTLKLSIIFMQQKKMRISV